MSTRFALRSLLLCLLSIAGCDTESSHPRDSQVPETADSETLTPDIPSSAPNDATSEQSATPSQGTESVDSPSDTSPATAGSTRHSSSEKQPATDESSHASAVSEPSEPKPSELEPSEPEPSEPEPSEPEPSEPEPSEPEPSEPEPVLFEEVTQVSGLEDAALRPSQAENIGFGAGAALVDVDGDGRLDLFVGEDTSGTHHACIYLNRSTPGDILFEAEPALCGEALGPMLSGITWPRAGDSRDDLLLLGIDEIRRVSFPPEGSPEIEVISLRYPLPEDDEARERCVAGAALVLDVTLDGVPELIIGCQAEHSEDLEDQIRSSSNRILRVDADGGLELLPPHTFPEYEDFGVTLALAHVDAQEDGLPDVFLINDTFSTVNMRFFDIRTGSFIRRCRPAEECVLDRSLLATDASAWGSFMGIAQVELDEGTHWYLSDWGPNRLIRFAAGSPTDEAPSRNATLQPQGHVGMFSWGAVVDDFNASGRDDLFISQGPTPGFSAESFVSHRDSVLLQTPDGAFISLDDEVGFRAPSIERSTLPDLPNSSRAAVKVDLDGNGRLELLVLDYSTAPRIYREVVPDERPLRCSVDPVSRYVPVVGTGISFAALPDGVTPPAPDENAAPLYDGPPVDFRTWDIQGQMRFGLPSRLLLPHTSGVLRFPSGAQVYYDCASDPGPVHVMEPEWLHIVASTDATRIEVAADAPWLGADDEEVRVRVVFLDAPSDDDPLELAPLAVVEEDHTVGALRAGIEWDVAANADTLMLAFNGRFIPRRFATDSDTNAATPGFFVETSGSSD